MKKLLHASLVFSILIAVFTITTTAETYGELNFRDVILIRQYIVGGYGVVLK